jgi:hypothetical protein
MVFISNPSAQPDFLSICCESNASPPHSGWLIICRKICLLPARADSDKLFALAPPSAATRLEMPEGKPAPERQETLMRTSRTPFFFWAIEARLVEYPQGR